MSNESLKPRNDRFSIDHKHLHSELVKAGIHDLLSIPTYKPGRRKDGEFHQYCFTCGEYIPITESKYRKLEQRLAKSVGWCTVQTKAVRSSLEKEK